MLSRNPHWDFSSAVHLLSMPTMGTTGRPALDPRHGPVQCVQCAYGAVYRSGEKQQSRLKEASAAVDKSL